MKKRKNLAKIGRPNSRFRSRTGHTSSAAGTARPAGRTSCGLAEATDRLTNIAF